MVAISPPIVPCTASSASTRSAPQRPRQSTHRYPLAPLLVSPPLPLLTACLPPPGVRAHRDPRLPRYRNRSVHRSGTRADRCGGGTPAAGDGGEGRRVVAARAIVTVAEAGAAAAAAATGKDGRGILRLGISDPSQSFTLYLPPILELIRAGLVSYTELAVADPIAVAVNAGGAGLAWLRPIVKVRR